MRTYKYIVQAKHLAQYGMHPVQFAAGQRAMRQTGLVGRGNEQETRRFELAQRFQRLGLRLHLLQKQWRHRLVSFHPVQNQYSVSLHKYGCSHKWEWSISQAMNGAAAGKMVSAYGTLAGRMQKGL
jgi:hypothetical protein